MDLGLLRELLTDAGQFVDDMTMVCVEVEGHPPLRIVSVETQLPENPPGAGDPGYEGERAWPTVWIRAEEI